MINLSRHLNSVRNPAFEHFMGIWFLCVAGASAIYTLYPVMMQEVYGIGQEVLSLAFAVAMGLFCAVFAAACVTGSALGGWLAAQWGYNAAAGMTVITDALGLMLMQKIKLAR